MVNVHESTYNVWEAGIWAIWVADVRDFVVPPDIPGSVVMRKVSAAALRASASWTVGMVSSAARSAGLGMAVGVAIDW
jgi:hypothetical protein